MITYFSIFFITGLCFGSFSTVLATRWKNSISGILMGRSACPKCQHTLTWKELVPIFSYLFQHGKCRNCHTDIPFFYPLAEGIMGTLFLLWGISTYTLDIWYTDISFWILGIWVFITGVYILYDIQYMEIPDQVLIPGIYGTGLLLFIGYFTEGINFFFDNKTYKSFQDLIIDHSIGAIILYTFLYLQILIPGGIHLLKGKKYKSLGGLIINYFTFFFTLPLTIFFKQNEKNGEEQIPTWIGGGDLRIALFIGLTVGTIHGISSFIFAYIIGSIVGIYLLIIQSIKQGKMGKEIAFGPFLGTGWILSVLFHEQILNFFNK